MAALGLGTLLALPIAAIAAADRGWGVTDLLGSLQHAWFGPTRPPDGPPPYTWTGRTEELDILEAVFRYQFAHNASSVASTRRTGCRFLALGNGDSQLDPPPELLSRFSDSTPAVFPVSSMTTDSPGASHRDHGCGGILFRVERIRRIDSKTVDVDGGYWESSLSASGNTYRVRLRGTSWTVTSEALWWIS